MLLPPVLLVCAALAGCATAQNPESQSAPTADAVDHVLPSVYVRDYFLLPLALNGEQDRVLWMLYDTGASVTVVDPQSLAAISTWEVGQSSRVNLQSMSCGAATFTDHSARVQDLDHIADALGFPLDGILGYTAFQGMLLTLDYPDREIRVRKGELPKADGKSIYRITRKERRRPFIEFDFGGREEEVLVDSGSGAGFVLRDRRGRDFSVTPLPVRVMVGINGPKAEKTGRLNGEAELFGRRFLQPAVRLTEGTELLGTQVLHHFSLTFDLSNRRLLVESDSSETVLPSVERSTGVMKSAKPDAHLVHFVLEGSAGERAGVRKGDRIVAINGVPHAERGAEGLPAFWDGDRRYVRMTIERDGEQLELEVDTPVVLPVPDGQPQAPPRLKLPRDLVRHTSDPAGPPAGAREAIGEPIPSPDGGRRVVVEAVREGSDETRLVVYDAAGHRLSVPVLTGVNLAPQWSADGLWLRYWTQGLEEGKPVWMSFAVPANGSQRAEPVPIR